MSIIKKIYNYFSSENIVNYNELLEEMDNKLNILHNDYTSLIELQQRIEKNTDELINAELVKKEKYIEEMEGIKYKDKGLIDEYNTLAIKFNIIIELLQKTKKYLSATSEKVNIMFDYDQIKQPIAIISHNNSDIHKIVLLKNTLNTEQFILYKLDNIVNILDISEFEYSYHLDKLIRIINDKVCNINAISNHPKIIVYDHIFNNFSLTVKRSIKNSELIDIKD